MAAPMDFQTSRLFSNGFFGGDSRSRSTGQPVSDHPAVKLSAGSCTCVDHFVGGCFFWGWRGGDFCLLLEGVKL